MSLLLKLLAKLRPARARYGDEVLLSGWVQLPKSIREAFRRH
jgi:hypothetical protein